ncbi:hypothetical protein B0H66DRAFT_473335 [Apodospora peruviana]|uniref:T6SS Phospholipase effector Tle1-like catalytic domain-containing protein n=1 Tax=Apodospora peruviana TaxID=516989 RepID=A0AAE0ICU3_9PEZI|nr:hypothetical protein B0H66DRAFT_473335 [Apodospora peruviana]
MSGVSEQAPRPDGQNPRKLILCFDGTGNAFTGTNADTNVVKLLNKLDRNNPEQFHYYQTGIGTYDVNASTVDKSWLASLKGSIDQTLDQGFGSGFDAHVLAGYRFLMRYYEAGDKIYIFGFSRGAFTARFLCRMVHTVGLLCKGNEEMVPFAYRLYQRYLAGEILDYKPTKAKKAAKKAAATLNGDQNSTTTLTPLATPAFNGVNSESQKPHDHNSVAANEVAAFADTFCRKELVYHAGEDKPTEHNVKVYFLGMWDCVSSVAVLESKAPKPTPVTGTAKYVRHAVAVDERRVKFKAALLAQDEREADEHDDHKEDIREVWFPGCHGDVGGGWPSSKKNPLDTREIRTQGWWARLKNVFQARKPTHGGKPLSQGRLQMSDVPLAWMIREIELVGEEDESAAVKWRPETLKAFKDKFQKKKEAALDGIYHDSLRFGYGTGFFKVLLWKFMEYLPFITRWELEWNAKEKRHVWANVRFPLNAGGTRDIPFDAVFHASLKRRLEHPTLNYCPTNNHGGDSTTSCLKHDGKVSQFKHDPKNESCSDPDHQTYVFTDIQRRMEG